MTVINENAGHQSSPKKKTKLEFFFYTAGTLEPVYIKK